MNKLLLDDILLQIINPSVSDVFVTAGRSVYARSKGGLQEFEQFCPSSEDVDSFRRSVIPEKLENAYADSGAVDCAYRIPESGQRCRLNFFASEAGPAIVIRPIKDADSLNFENLSLPPVLADMVENNRGIILVTGATGSGKSSTMAAMINKINNTQSKHILTIEDPIEFVYDNKKSLISQREIFKHTESFPEAIRNSMRENPDVIVIGEMRDAETLQSALNAALTGHLVISTVHTSNAVLALERLISMVDEDHREQTAIDLSLAMVGIVSQRLVPRRDETGVVPAVEILMGTPLVRKLIAERNFTELDQTLRESTGTGMCTFNRSVYKLYQQHIISEEAAFDAVDNPDEFRLLLQGMEAGVDAFRSHYGERIDGDEDPAIDMATLLRSAVKLDSSDLILTVGAYPSVRLNGSLQPMDLPRLESVDTQRLLYSVISSHQRVIFEEERELDFALAVTFSLTKDPKDEKVFRFRLNAFYQRGNIGIVARVINSEIPSAEELNMPPVLLDLAQYKQGLILVTGPTGSGKSTTLACLINEINKKRNAHIITVENPIEYVHNNINSVVEQRELHEDTMSFSAALKYALRQDPDVIMVGEMRDTETMEAAITAAETGHLVFATVHTNSAPQTIDRIVDSFPEGQQNQIKLQLAGCILGVVSQRLLRRLDGSGRIAAFEVMVGTAPVRALVREGKTHQLQSAMETGAKDGMITLDTSLDLLYSRGLVSYKEIQGYRLKESQIEAF